jgi:hypothetical protein
MHLYRDAIHESGAAGKALAADVRRPRRRKEQDPSGAPTPPGATGNRSAGHAAPTRCVQGHQRHDGPSIRRSGPAATRTPSRLGGAHEAHPPAWRPTCHPRLSAPRGNGSHMPRPAPPARRGPRTSRWGEGPAAGGGATTRRATHRRRPHGAPRAPPLPTPPTGPPPHYTAGSKMSSKPGFDCRCHASRKCS